MAATDGVLLKLRGSKFKNFLGNNPQTSLYVTLLFVGVKYGPIKIDPYSKCASQAICFQHFGLPFHEKLPPPFLANMYNPVDLLGPRGSGLNWT